MCLQLLRNVNKLTIPPRKIQLHFKRVKLLEQRLLKFYRKRFKEMCLGWKTKWPIVISVPKGTVTRRIELLYLIAEKAPFHIASTRIAANTKASKNHWMNRSEKINNLPTSITSVTFHLSFVMEHITRRNMWKISEKDKMAIHVDSIRASNMYLTKNLKSNLESPHLKRLPFRCLTSKHIRITL